MQTDSDNQTIIGQYRITCDQEARQTLQIELDLVPVQIATTQETIVSCLQTTSHLISEAVQTQESLLVLDHGKTEYNLQVMVLKIVYHPEREISSPLLVKREKVQAHVSTLMFNLGSIIQLQESPDLEVKHLQTYQLSVVQASNLSLKVIALAWTTEV